MRINNKIHHSQASVTFINCDLRAAHFAPPCESRRFSLTPALEHTFFFRQQQQLRRRRKGLCFVIALCSPSALLLPPPPLA
jgi:hypothetical protein